MTEYITSRLWKNCDMETVHSQAKGNVCTLDLFVPVLMQYFFVEERAESKIYEMLHFECSQKGLAEITSIIKFLGYSDPEPIGLSLGYDNPPVAKIKEE